MTPNEKKKSPADSASRARASSHPVWVISDNDELCERIAQLLAQLVGSSRRVRPAEIEDSKWQPGPELPCIVILDVNDDAEAGLRVLQSLRRRRVHGPVIVMTSCFSRDFGFKILQEGVRYYFSHDFCTEEFIAVLKSLLTIRRPIRHMP